ncbi:MAG: PilX N-terminal domain-containing pilus assembly protein [Nitrospirota bacterium]
MLKNEKGAALLMALIMLLLLTLIGFAAITTSSVEVQISGNQRLANTAIYAAEAAIESIRQELSNCSTAEVITLTNATSASPNPNYAIYAGIQSYPSKGTLGQGDRWTKSPVTLPGRELGSENIMYVFIVEGNAGFAAKRVDTGIALPEKCVAKKEGGPTEYPGGTS